MTSLGPYDTNLDGEPTAYSDRVEMHAFLALVNLVNRSTASKI